MRYAITGGAGFIGNNIARLLIENRHEVIILDNLHVGKKENLVDISEKIEFFKVDIRNKNKLELILKDIDGIFHEAALTSVPESFKKPEEYREVNILGTKNIFDIALKHKIRVVFASSSSIYGNTIQIPIKEDFPKNPINPYGKTKLEDEILAESYSKKGLEVIGLRYFNVYGIGQTGSYAGVITKFMECVKMKKPLIIFGDGKQIRDFIYVKEIADANLSAMISDIEFGFFNIGTGVTTSITNLANIIIKITKHKEGIQYSDSLEGDVGKSQADIDLSTKKLKWKSNVSLEEGLKNLF